MPYKYGPGRFECGTTKSYRTGCRCMKCRAANTQYYREYLAANEAQLERRRESSRAYRKRKTIERHAPLQPPIPRTPRPPSKRRYDVPLISRYTGEVFL